jgi:hypothetical protein
MRATFLKSPVLAFYLQMQLNDHFSQYTLIANVQQLEIVSD